MRTLKQGFEECYLMAKLAEELTQKWLLRLAADYPASSPATRDSIIRWLLGEDLERFDNLTASQLAIALQSMDYRYQILRQRYLGVTPERAYRHLISKLGSLTLLRNKIRTWVSLSRDRQRAVVDVLEEVIQELLHSDRYIQQQILWIAQCTQDAHLCNALLLTTVEEYCLRPIRNQPLLVYRFVNYLRRTQRGGITHVPDKELVRLVSEEMSPDETESPLSLLDDRAVADYQEHQIWEEQQAARTAVKEEFETYLGQNIGSEAVEWLRLYLEGQSPEAIAQAMNKPVKDIYRLREKINYHAIKVFALKTKPELVASWLQISLQEHNLGLTPAQWQQMWTSLTTEQCQLIEQLKAGKSIEDFAREAKQKTNQVMGEWIKIYLAAQSIRSQHPHAS